MKEYIRFILDKRILSALIILFSMELCLQLGAYKPFLKKNSYAANVNRITAHALNVQDKLDPDILILGTSVAFEGLSVRILNEEIKDTGYTVQTLAIPGSELVVQDQVVAKYLKKFPNTKAILHVMEAGMPWVDRNELILPTLAMLSELDNWNAISIIKDFEYKYNWQDIMYLIFKSIAYRRDMKDFLTDPQERIKFLGREWREPNTELWDYDNPHTETVSAYGVRTVEECIERTNPANGEPIPEGSNDRHKKMLFDTCILSRSTTDEMGSTERTQRYFRRLGKIYEQIPQEKIAVIHVFAPYSEIIYHFGKDRRMPLWKKELDQVTQNKLGYEKADIIDLESLLDGPNNGDFCFDLIHLNKAGMEIFSSALGKILRDRIKTNTLLPPAKK
ncbi:MAG: SGNH/GDSL hydrolase family protein [Leptospira sp.]|nr:SGNH/GDSL hydrolase family protein [Leptospira sp.]